MLVKDGKDDFIQDYCNNGEEPDSPPLLGQVGIYDRK